MKVLRDKNKTTQSFPQQILILDIDIDQPVFYRNFNMLPNFQRNFKSWF